VDSHTDTPAGDRGAFEQRHFAEATNARKALENTRLDLQNQLLRLPIPTLSRRFWQTRIPVSPSESYFLIRTLQTSMAGRDFARNFLDYNLPFTVLYWVTL
jgi:hypothetical protein